MKAAQLNAEPLGGLYVHVSEAALNDIYKPNDALSLSWLRHYTSFRTAESDLCTVLMGR